MTDVPAPGPRPPAARASGAGAFTRRRLFGVGAGAALAGAAAGVGGAYAAQAASADPAIAATGVDAVTGTVDFRGAHQAGIVTPAQDRMHFAAFDAVTTDRAALLDLLTAWTRASERMVAGAEAAPGGFVGGGPYAAPADTGEAYDLDPAQLTITIGYGPSLFDDRFGLAPRRPVALEPLPGFVGDDLDPARSGGDLAIQACANDPQVAVHAIRNLARIGVGVVAVRWSQLGFGRTSSTTRSQTTPRNMFGFKDGTANVKAEDTAALDEHVWVQPGDETGRGSWMTGGTYLVARRIRMHIEVWDRSTLVDQEQTIGRSKSAGAPLGKKDELETLDFSAKGGDGELVVPIDAHVRLAHPDQLDGVQILRRGYNFTDGSDGVGHLDAGLFFIAFCRNAAQQFVPMQRSLASKDALNEYIEHTGSALFAVPPGVSPDQDWGTQLFG